jgi:predicted AAA+ superfamily ATPase
MDCSNKKGKHKMSYNKLRKIYCKLSLAYSANLDANGEPENEEVSGNLGEVMEMIDELMQRATK